MEEKGDALVMEGEKILKKFSLFSSNDDKVDKAHEKFQQAATQYKAAGNFAKAAGAYHRAAEMSQKSKNEGEMCIEMEEAAKAYVKAGDINSAVSHYKQVVDIYDKGQKHVNAAKACVALGEITQGNEAMQWLQRAVKYYKTQGSKVTATEIVEKMANVKANGGDYAGAREIYDELARDALDDRVSRGNARKLFFSSLLAQIACMTNATLMEDVGVLQERFEEYQELDTQFNQNTREHMLISALIDAMQAEDPDAYEEAVQEYDSIVPLDPVRQKMLLKGKQVLRSRVNDLR